ncbi:MAG TPA: 2-amino-4-hydroxy-6-hydroxymethyldihydropteridine diphosphokinase [Gemmatimonadaceae bacterium]|nr:2-amino-4-hydroxy-6-hydroxymethyldihydropteridine diphosphokinase [Gemmatimonadaceae bacterium]
MSDDVAYIALGSNLGDRDAMLARARKALGHVKGIRVLRATEVEETEPIGPVAQGKFLNQMLAVETDLSPRALLAALQRIERAAGRLRTVRWGPRTLDMDIVLIEGVEFSNHVLTVPHPELPNRDFWLRQLAELRGVSDGR